MSDLISREAVINALDAICERECEYSKKQRAYMCGSCHLGSAFDAIDELPAAEPNKRVKRTERGWAGHFRGSRNCVFRRNTLLEYADRKWVVSTVGAYFVDGKLQTIGHERYYETKAFEVDPEDVYLDADVNREIEFDSPWAITAKSKEDLFDKIPFPDKAADNMHETVVAELTEKIRG